jgi:aminoglycoside phosphotransferase (APT) family kinase protein
MEFTTERLTRLLGQRVESFAIEPIGLFSSKVSRLTVTLPEVAHPKTFICKEPHPEHSDRVGESFATEARFYEEIAPQLPIRVPGCHAYAKNLLLLEDVEYVPFSWQQGASEAHTSAAFAALRRLHHSAVGTPTWIPAFGDPEFRAALSARFSESWTRHCDALCQWCPEFESIGNHLNVAVESYYAALASPAALLHGDAHLENIPLMRAADDEQVVFFDWQGPRLGHPLFDVAYFNVMSFPVDVRRSKEPTLLEAYLGRAWEAAEQTAYRFAVAARASGIVEMTANWSPEQITQPGFGWVAKRCFSAAVDHRVQELLD